MPAETHLHIENRIFFRVMWKTLPLFIILRAQNVRNRDTAARPRTLCGWARHHDVKSSMRRMKCPGARARGVPTNFTQGSLRVAMRDDEAGRMSVPPRHEILYVGWRCPQRLTRRMSLDADGKDANSHAWGSIPAALQFSIMEAPTAQFSALAS